ncbi:hypothetical protein BH23ACT1_BH23ACT1_02340 [soil metagenome]
MSSRSRSSRSRPAVVVLAVVCGLALGIGITVVLTGSDDEAPTAGPLEVTDPSTTQPSDPEAPPGASASSPQAAVEGFLGAEVAEDFEASFGFLSAAARTEFGSPSGWIASHADLVPPIEGYEVEEVDDDEVVTLVRFVPSLDQIQGLVAERVRVTWATSDDGGSWGVDLLESMQEPLYPSDESAPAAVRAWAEGHQDCGTPRTWEGNLQGSPALAERLCGVAGEVEVGPPLPLGPVDAGPFLAAFGPAVGGWARIVAVTAPVELRAVVAPIGQEWLVIGVLPG